MLEEINDACAETNCRDIFFFININHKPEDEKPFEEIITDLDNSFTGKPKFIFRLQKLSPVVCEDLGLWIENYVTEIPFKKNKIISEYLEDLDDEFPMMEAEEKIYDFINKVNNKDPHALEILD